VPIESIITAAKPGAFLQDFDPSFLGVIRKNQ